MADTLSRRRPHRRGSRQTITATSGSKSVHAPMAAAWPGHAQTGSPAASRSAGTAVLSRAAGCGVGRAGARGCVCWWAGQGGEGPGLGYDGAAAAMKVQGAAGMRQRREERRRGGTGAWPAEEQPARRRFFGTPQTQKNPTHKQSRDPPEEVHAVGAEAAGGLVRRLQAATSAVKAQHLWADVCRPGRQGWRAPSGLSSREGSRASRLEIHACCDSPSCVGHSPQAPPHASRRRPIKATQTGRLSRPTLHTHRQHFFSRCAHRSQNHLARLTHRQAPPWCTKGTHHLRCPPTLIQASVQAAVIVCSRTRPSWKRPYLQQAERAGALRRVWGGAGVGVGGVG